MSFLVVDFFKILLFPFPAPERPDGLTPILLYELLCLLLPLIYLLAGIIELFGLIF